MSDHDTPAGEDAPKVFLHPPTMTLAAFVLGYGVRLAYGGFLPAPRALAEGLGGAMVIAAMALILASVQAFSEASETLRPATPSYQLLKTGPYRFSRNPIYLAMVLFVAGFGVATLNIWMVLFSAVNGALLHFFVILREEEYLAGRFGADYDAYRKSIRRWI